MDPVTHLVSGGIQGTALKPLVQARRLILFCVLAAWIPDIDNLAGFFGPQFYLIHHRGITHSFIGGLVLAGLFTVVFHLWDRTLPLGIGWLVAYAGVLNHIFLDLITSYGTQIFMPFSRTRYTVQCVYIIDPFFTLSLILFLLLTRIKPQLKTRIACFGLVWLVAYPMLSLGVRTALESHLKERLRQQGVAFSHLAVSTEAFSPINWKVILNSGDHYRMAGVSVLAPNAPLRFEDFTKADRPLLERLGDQVPFFRTYAWFAMYPVMTIEPGKFGRTVTFSDLRFRSTVPFVLGMFHRGNGPFTLTAMLDDRGTLLAYAYKRPRGTKVVQHLQ